MRIVASQAAGATTKLPFTLDTDDNGDYIRFFNGREPIHGAGVATFLHTQVIAAAAAQERADKEVLYCDGHSETRFVHYRNDFDDSYCYTELEEGYNDLHTLHVAQVYDDDFEKWHGLAAQPKEQQPTQGGKETE
jgi:hypothetical protein